MGFTKYRIIIFSANPDELMKFYRDVLDLKQIDELKLPDDYGYKFKIMDEFELWISKHSEVKGSSEDNFRHIFNIYPEEGVEYWYDKIKNDSRVKIVAEPFLAPFSTEENQVWCSTFLDPEGNCWQFVGKK